MKTRFLLFFLAITALATSCLSSYDENDFWTEETAESTGLCGTKWVLDTIMGDSIPRDITQESYVFNLDGTGVQDYTSNDQSVTRSFTWKSYRYGTGHKLSMIFKGYEHLGAAESMYMIHGYYKLRIMVSGSGGLTITKQFLPEKKK